MAPHPIDLGVGLRKVERHELGKGVLQCILPRAIVLVGDYAQIHRGPYHRRCCRLEGWLKNASVIGSTPGSVLGVSYTFFAGLCFPRLRGRRCRAVFFLRYPMLGARQVLTVV